MNRATLTLSAALILRPLTTLRREASGPPTPCKRTALLLALPLIVTSVMLSQILYQVIPPGLPPEAIPHPVGFGVYSVLMMAFGVMAMALSAHYLAELFQGSSDPDRSLRAVTLALIPAWLGNVAAAFPWPWGNGAALGLILYSLVLLYLGFREVLGIRRGNRIGHYVATLVCALFLCFVIGWLLVDLVPGARPEVRLGTTWLI